MSLFDVVLGRVAKPTKNGDWYTSLCPVHETNGNGHHPSLRFNPATQVADGVVVTCMAGCSREDLAAALGLTDVRAKTSASDPNTFLFWTKQEDAPSAVYDYTDENGVLLYQKVRYEPKKFLQRRPSPDGHWIWGLDEGEYAQSQDGDWSPVRDWTAATAQRKTFPALKTRVLYHLPDVLAAAAEGGTVFNCEGEKAADAVRSLGLVSTTAGMGAKKWRAGHTQALAGARVVVIPDADEEGRLHGETVIAALRKSGIECCTCRLPGLPEKGDAYDAVKNGLDADTLTELAADAFARREETETQELYREQAPDFHLTDMGNAERLSHRHAGAILSVRGGRGLMAYDSDRGIFSTDGVIAQRYATETVRSIYAEASEADDITQRRLLAEHARRSESRNAISAMLHMAEPLRELEAWLEDFDADPELLNVRNGVVSLTDGKLHPHDPKYRMTRSCTAAYLDTPCPTWKAHLQRIFDGNQDRIAFVQRLFGYSATGYSREQVFVVCYGGGANGKGVTLNTVRTILGDYGASPAFTTFTMHRNDAIRNDLAALAGARLVTTAENRPGQTLDDGVIKQVTGCDPISARFLHCEHFTFVPGFVILLSTNHKPRVEVADYAMKRRVILLPFDVTIPPQEWDRNMETKLLAERDGILAWIVRGAMLYLAYGLEPPEDVTAATEQYREELDPLASFAESLTFDEKAWTTAADLRSALERWGREEGLKTVPDGRSLGAWLTAHGVVPERHHGGVRGWRGVRCEDADSEQSFEYDG